MKNRQKKEDKIITMFGGGRLLSSRSRLDKKGISRGEEFVGKVSPSRAKIMGIRVKETAAVSTYLEWKASTGGGGQEAERALRVLLTQMISRLDIQRGIL